MARKPKVFTEEESRKFVKKFYQIPEDDLQAMIVRAQQGSEEDLTQLLEVFNHFLTKYVNLLYNGKYSLDEQDVRKFIAMFIRDTQLRLWTLRNKLTPKGRRAVTDIMNGIKYMVQRYGTREDVEQTVRMSFIHCLMRYQRRGSIPFSGYIYSYFCYVILKNVKELLIDDHGLHSFPLVTDEEGHSSEEGAERPSGYTLPIVESELLNLIPDEIDEHWVLDTAMPPFDSLSVHQRQLVRWRYILGESTAVIASRVGEHPNLIRNEFSKIRSVLSEVMISDSVEVP